MALSLSSSQNLHQKNIQLSLSYGERKENLDRDQHQHRRDDRYLSTNNKFSTMVIHNKIDVVSNETSMKKNRIEDVYSDLQSKMNVCREEFFRIHLDEMV